MAQEPDEPSNVHYLRALLSRALHEPLKPEPVDDDGEQIQGKSMADERLARLEGAYDALKVVRPMTVAVIAVLLTAAIGAIAFLGVQVATTNSRIDRLNDKLDALPAKLNDELRAMRSDMAAQTSALANAITATKQQAPQVILVPAPQTPSPPAPPQTPNKQ
jgi:uncharacterized coiled-coil protein SlyX